MARRLARVALALVAVLAAIPDGASADGTCRRVERDRHVCVAFETRPITDVPRLVARMRAERIEATPEATRVVARLRAELAEALLRTRLFDCESDEGGWSVFAEHPRVPARYRRDVRAASIVPCAPTP